MLFTVVIVVGLLVYFASMFTGGKSCRETREIFYGNYYAEDALINTEDRPNSKEAVLNCVENGIGIKTEVYLTKDNRVVVSTYSDMNREYGLDKNIADVTADEIEELGILTLTDLVNLTEGKVPLILELKVGHDNQTLCRLVADAIKESNRQNIAVCSFHTGMITWFRDRQKDVFRGVVSAPSADFKNLSKLQRFMTGNLANNGNMRPNFMLYRNKPYSVFVKFAIASGVLNGVWTVEDPQEGKKLEEIRDMIVVRGFMPETVHFRDLPAVQLTEEQEKALAKAEAAKRPVRQRSIAEILEDDEPEDEEMPEELQEEFEEFADNVKEEIAEFVEETKEEISEIKEKMITLDEE